MRFDTSGRKLDSIEFYFEWPTVIHTIISFSQIHHLPTLKQWNVRRKTSRYLAADQMWSLNLEQYSNAHCSIGRSFKVENGDLIIIKRLQESLNYIMN